MTNKRLINTLSKGEIILKNIKIFKFAINISPFNKLMNLYLIKLLRNDNYNVIREDYLVMLEYYKGYKEKLKINDNDLNLISIIGIFDYEIIIN